MKWWYHLIAAIIGFALAALIVTFVFGSASKEGTATGPAPVQSQGGSDSGADCGSINPASVTDPAVIAKAANELPTISQAARPITPTKSDQITWFARLHAASGLCIDEVDVATASMAISSSYPSTMVPASVDAFSYATLARAFEPPLARRAIKLVTAQGPTTRTAVVTKGAWDAFQRARAARGLPPTMAGLAASRKKLAFGKREVQLTGW